MRFSVIELPASVKLPPRSIRFVIVFSSSSLSLWQLFGDQMSNLRWLCAEMKSPGASLYFAILGGQHNGERAPSRATRTTGRLPAVSTRVHITSFSIADEYQTQQATSLSTQRKPRQDNSTTSARPVLPRRSRDV